jgi:hypothetical protein
MPMLENNATQPWLVLRRVRCRPRIRPLQRIREFRNRPNPKVVVTADVLSTGVDREGMSHRRLNKCHDDTK